MSRILVIFIFSLLTGLMISIGNLEKIRVDFLDIFFTKKIEEIKIVNLNNVSEEYIINSLNIDTKKSFWKFNPKELKKKLERINEIESFHFHLSPSGILEINIKENSPFMIWNNNGKINYIDKNGKILKFNYFSSLNLIYLHGKNANERVSDLNAILEKYDKMKSKLKKILYVADVSWNLILNDQKCLQVPTKNLEKIFNIHEKIKKLPIYNQYKKIDMKISGRVYFSNNECLI